MTNYKKERLIATGKLDAGGSVLMIEHMEKTGKIEKIGDYNIYRIASSCKGRRMQQHAIMALDYAALDTTLYNKEEALARFIQSNLLECRVNAYPDYTEFKGIIR